MSDRDTTASLLTQLEAHYVSPADRLPAGVFLPEVGWNGYTETRRCDAIWVGFTSASGRLLVGHEIKASRSDWLNELRKLDKADAWADQCHQWWLVTVPGVVKDGELPAGWGLMTPGGRGRRMKIEVPARTVTDRLPSWDATRSIIARLNTLHRNTLHDKAVAARAEMEKSFQARVDREVERRTAHDRAPEQVQALLDRYEQILGGHLVDGDNAHGTSYTDADLALFRDWLAARRKLARTGHGLDNLYGLRQLRNLIDAAAAAAETLTRLEADAEALARHAREVA